jgi:antitoxin (DNA-binding transcriptional repressor) of toxin-antitoxin stability system
MIKINIHEAKTHLSRYLGKLSKGETIILYKRNNPIAEIHPIPLERKSKRLIGLAKGKFEVPQKFFDPFPPKFISTFRRRSGITYYKAS